MPRESKKAKTARAAEAFDLLTEEYPEAHCELDFVDAFQLGVATILSAQTTDVRVNMVTPELFRRYPGAEALANAAQEDVEQVVKSTGFFRNKSKNIIGFARGLMADHDGAVPKTMAELSALPGVGRKTANVVVSNAYGVPAIAVDTHVGRLARRLGFSKHDDPDKVEADLQKLFDPADWVFLHHGLILHGRRVCAARKPNCAGCGLAAVCPSRQA